MSSAAVSRLCWFRGGLNDFVLLLICQCDGTFPRNPWNRLITLSVIVCQRFIHILLYYLCMWVYLEVGVGDGLYSHAMGCTEHSAHSARYRKGVMPLLPQTCFARLCQGLPVFCQIAKFSPCCLFLALFFHSQGHLITKHRHSSSGSFIDEIGVRAGTSKHAGFSLSLLCHHIILLTCI